MDTDTFRIKSKIKDVKERYADLYFLILKGNYI